MKTLTQISIPLILSLALASMSLAYSEPSNDRLLDKTAGGNL